MIITKYCVDLDNGITREFPTEEQAVAFADSVNAQIRVNSDEVSEAKSQVVEIGEKFDGGYLDESGIRLKSSDKAQQKFTSALVLTQTALMAGFLTMDSITEIWDYDDNKVELTVQQFIGLMLKYGMFIKSRIES